MFIVLLYTVNFFSIYAMFCGRLVKQKEFQGEQPIPNSGYKMEFKTTSGQMKNYKMTKDTCHMYQNYIQRIVETIYKVTSHYWNYVKEKLVLNILKSIWYKSVYCLISMFYCSLRIAFLLHSLRTSFLL